MCFDTCPCIEHYTNFFRFIDVGHCVVWDIIGFVAEVIIPFVDVDIASTCFFFKVWQSIEPFL